MSGFETPAMTAARLAAEQQQARYAAQLAAQQAQQTQYPMGQYQVTALAAAEYLTQKR